MRERAARGTLIRLAGQVLLVLLLNNLVKSGLLSVVHSETDDTMVY